MRTKGLAWGIWLVLLGGCGPTSFLITPIPRARDLVEHEVARESFWASNKIAMIDVSGVIMNDSPRSLLGMPDERPLATFRAKLDKAADDSSVKAVVLKINSPGGGVTASDIMHHELKRFRERSGKPVIAALMDVAASGGYYIACAADRIIAQPTTTTGSIGVVMMLPNVSGTLARIGAGVNVIKSGDKKDAGSPFRPMTDDDRAIYQEMIDRMYARFVAIVAAGRDSLDESAVRRIADGRVYTAEQAHALGLVDDIGSLQAAIDTARRAAGLVDSRGDARPIIVVEYAPAWAYKPNIYAGQGSGSPQVNLIHVELPRWLSLDGPQFLYLWAPGW